MNTPMKVALWAFAYLTWGACVAMSMERDTQNRCGARPSGYISDPSFATITILWAPVISGVALEHALAGFRSLPNGVETYCPKR